MIEHPSPSSSTPSRVRRFAPALVLALIVFVWLANSAGLVSSNDASHLALARALVLRGETTIDPDRALTLEVDLAIHEGHSYSDRPPGTAFAALAAVWIGDRLDPLMAERAKAQARAGEAVSPLPGAEPYLLTYAKRKASSGARGPNLVALIGTSLAIVCHAALIGLLGLVLVDALLRRLDVDAGPRLVALACLGLGSAWGPYSSVLFSHVSAATAVAGFLLGLVILDADEERPAVAALTGLAGAWAIACDYALVLAIVPASVLAIDRRRWPIVLLGTAPIVLATLAYHHAAFGSWHAIGYDHQRNFAFARARASTFAGGFFEGLWVLWGLGRGAGLLAQAPIVLVGLVGLGVAIRERERGPSAPARAGLRRLAWALLGFSPWLLALAMHETPWGGGTEDHRYLIPISAFAAVGLGLAWARANAAWRALIAAVALASSVLVWRHFLGWHDGVAFARIGLGAGAAAVVFAAASLSQKLRP